MRKFEGKSKSERQAFMKNNRLFAFFFLLFSFPSFAQQKISFVKAVQMAKQYSLYLKTENYNVANAQAGVTMAKTRPNMYFNTQIIQIAKKQYQPDSSSYFSPYNNQFWFQVTKLFQVGNQRKNKIQLAQDNLLFSEYNYKAFENQHFNQICLKWLDVWYAKEKIELLKYERSDMDTMLTFLQKKDIKTNQVEYIRTSHIRLQYDLLLNAAQKEYENEMLNLKLLTGIEEEIELDSVGTINEFMFSEDPVTLFKLAAANRPDLMAYRQLAKVGQSQDKYLKSTIIGQPEFGGIYSPQNKVPYVGIYLTVPLPVFDRNQGQRQMARIQQYQANTYADLTVKKIETDLINALNNYAVAKANVDKVQDFLEDADYDLEITKKMFLSQKITFLNYLSYLDAEKGLFDTGMQNLASLQDFYQAKIQVLYLANLLDGN